MKNIFDKILYPEFLNRLDNSLAINHPLFWELQWHYKTYYIFLIYILSLPSSFILYFNDPVYSLSFSSIFFMVFIMLLFIINALSLSKIKPNKNNYFHNSQYVLLAFSAKKHLGYPLLISLMIILPSQLFALNTNGEFTNEISVFLWLLSYEVFLYIMDNDISVNTKILLAYAQMIGMAVFLFFSNESPFQPIFQGTFSVQNDSSLSNNPMPIDLSAGVIILGLILFIFTVLGIQIFFIVISTLIKTQLNMLNKRDSKISGYLEAISLVFPTIGIGVLSFIGFNDFNRDNILQGFYAPLFLLFIAILQIVYVKIQNKYLLLPLD